MDNIEREIILQTEKLRLQAEENRKRYIQSKGIAYDMYITAKNAGADINGLTTEEKYEIIVEKIKDIAKTGLFCCNTEKLPYGIYSFYDSKLNELLLNNGFDVKQDNFSHRVTISWDFRGIL